MVEEEEGKNVYIGGVVIHTSGCLPWLREQDGFASEVKCLE